MAEGFLVKQLAVGRCQCLRLRPAIEKRPRFQKFLHFCLKNKEKGYLPTSRIVQMPFLAGTREGANAGCVQTFLHLLRACQVSRYQCLNSET